MAPTRQNTGHSIADIPLTPINATCPIKNQIPLDVTGYISKEKLTKKLKELFPHVTNVDDFQIDTRSKRFVFYTPKEVPAFALSGLQEAPEYNRKRSRRKASESSQG